MKQEEPIIEKINGYLADAFEVDASLLKPEANIRDVLELDSLDFVDLVVVIENNFSFKVKPEELQAITTLNDFHQYVISRMPSKEPNDAFLAGKVER